MKGVPMKFPDTEGSMDGKNYLKLKDKESARGVFRGDPYLFRIHWTGQKSAVCSGVSCPHCKVGEKSSFRFRINFLLRENDQFVAKIWEQGWKVYLQLKALHESDYDLEKTTVKVSRTGSDKNDTSYAVLPVPNGILSPEGEAKLRGIPLHDLAVFESAESPEEKTPSSDSHFDEDVPF